VQLRLVFQIMKGRFNFEGGSANQKDS
jgi:hypothetical protein